MTKLKSGIVLAEGENVVAELEAELWAASSNPIAKLIGQVQKIISMILGHRRKGFLVITDKRVIEVINFYNCYVFNTDKGVKYVLPSSIKEVGYLKSTVCGVFCPAYNLYYDSHTQRTSIQLQDADEATAQKLVDAFYNAIAATQKVDL